MRTLTPWFRVDIPREKERWAKLVGRTDLLVFPHIGGFRWRVRSPGVPAVFSGRRFTTAHGAKLSAMSYIRTTGGATR